MKKLCNLQLLNSSETSKKKHHTTGQKVNQNAVTLGEAWAWPAGAEQFCLALGFLFLFGPSQKEKENKQGMNDYSKIDKKCFESRYGIAREQS